MSTDRHKYSRISVPGPDVSCLASYQPSAPALCRVCGCSTFYRPSSQRRLSDTDKVLAYILAVHLGSLFRDRCVPNRFEGREGYATKPAAFFKRMASRPSLDGLYPNCFERSSGVITFGADGDSFYEYVCEMVSDSNRIVRPVATDGRCCDHFHLTAKSSVPF